MKRSMLVLSIVTSTFCSALVSADSLESRLGIINGNVVQPFEPIAKSIVEIFDMSGSCSGVLLSDSVVITAAHCPLAGAGAVGSTVVFYGAKNKSCGKATVDSVRYHPDSIADNSGEEKSKLPDFSLLHLSKPICGAMPAILDPDLELKQDDLINEAGYGQGNRREGQAEKTQLKFIPQSKEAVLKIYEGEDKKLVSDFSEFLDANLKYYNFAIPAQENTTACFGDSGGPSYIVKNGQVILLGVISTGIPHSKGSADCQGGYMNFTTNLKPYTSWIFDQVKNWKPQIN